MELRNLLQPTMLKGAYAEVFRATVNGATVIKERKALPQEDGNFLFQPEFSPMTYSADSVQVWEYFFAEVQAYYQVNRIYQWFVDYFGFKRISRGGKQDIDTFVNVVSQVSGWGQDDDIPLPYDAPFFGDLDGNGTRDLVFAQGEELDHAYDAETIYHEFTHSVAYETVQFDMQLDG